MLAVLGGLFKRVRGVQQTEQGLASATTLSVAIGALACLALWQRRRCP